MIGEPYTGHLNSSNESLLDIPQFPGRPLEQALPEKTDYAEEISKASH